MYLRSALSLALVIGLTTASSAAPIFERPAAQRTDLSEHIGKTFLQTLLTPVVGLDAEMDAEIYKPVTIVPGAQMVTAIGSFDPNVAGVFDLFTGREASFLQAVSGLEGQAVVPGQLRAPSACHIVYERENMTATRDAKFGWYPANELPALQV